MSILSLGTVVIHQSFLRSASLFGRYANQLRSSLWAQEQLWQAQEETLYSKEGGGSGGGTVTLSGRDFTWSQTAGEPQKDLYELSLDMQWQEGSEAAHRIREVYAFKVEPSQG